MPPPNDRISDSFSVSSSRSKNFKLFLYFEKVLDSPRLLIKLRHFRTRLFTADSGPRVVEGQNKCWKFIGGGTVAYGYPKFRFYEAGQYFKVCSVLHFLSNPHSHRLDSNYEYSHLCSKKNCVNPSHIVLESHSDNSLKRRCDRLKKCVCGNETPCLFPR